MLAIKQLEIKPTMNYHCTPFRMANIKNSDNTKCWWGQGEQDLSYIAGGNVKLYNHSGQLFDCFWNQIVIFHMIQKL